MDEYEVGQVISTPYPFIREEVELPCDDGPGTYKTISWRPGVRFEPDGTGQGYDAVADGVGAHALEVVSIHHPGPKRRRYVFYVRQWKTPDGKIFGRKNLRITTLAAFTQRARGYRHRYEVAS